MSTGAQLAHLDWAVRSRARNQTSALELLKLLETHKKSWQTKKLSRPAQDLVGITFSLWRAAFLAEKTGKRTAVLNDARVFLTRMIEDNAISYPNDKSSREFTFNYYIGNARAALERLHANYPDLVEKYALRGKPAPVRWEYCQDLFDKALKNFAQYLDKPKQGK